MVSDGDIVYALMCDYEGGHAVFTTLDAAIRHAQTGNADSIEEWRLDDAWYSKVVWTRKGEGSQR